MIWRLAPWLGLLAASILLWQVRFVAVPHLINGDVGFEQEMDGWVTEGGPNGVRMEDGLTVARFARPARDGEFSSAGRWLGGLEGVRYLRVEVEAKWNDIVAGSASWARPRLVLVTKDPQGRIRFPLDHGAYLAHGTRDWHRQEVVFELTPEMSDVGLIFQMLGKQGQMEARRFRLTALHRRPWVPVATLLLLAGWVLWVGSRLRGPQHNVAWWRAVPTAAAVVVCTWYVVFPGPRMQSRSLVGTFVTGEANPLPTTVVASDPPPDAPVAATGETDHADPAHRQDAPRQSDLDEAAVVIPNATNPAPSTRPPPAPRSQPWITKGIRKLDHKTSLLHIGAFFALSIGVFLAIGTLAPWRLLVVISILSEIVPNWHNRRTDAADLFDLLTNLSGVALAAGTFILLARLAPKFERFLPGRKRVPESPGEASADHAEL